MHKTVFWANPGLLLFIFVLFFTLQFKFKMKKESVDVVLGIRTRGGRMIGRELWRRPQHKLYGGQIWISLCLSSFISCILQPRFRIQSTLPYFLINNCNTKEYDWLCYKNYCKIMIFWLKQDHWPITILKYWRVNRTRLMWKRDLYVIMKASPMHWPRFRPAWSDDVIICSIFGHLLHQTFSQ